MVVSCPSMPRALEHSTALTRTLREDTGRFLTPSLSEVSKSTLHWAAKHPVTAGGKRLVTLDPSTGFTSRPLPRAHNMAAMLQQSDRLRLQDSARGAKKKQRATAMLDPFKDRDNVEPYGHRATTRDPLHGDAAAAVRTAAAGLSCSTHAAVDNFGRQPQRHEEVGTRTGALCGAATVTAAVTPGFNSRDHHESNSRQPPRHPGITLASGLPVGQPGPVGPLRHYPALPLPAPTAAATCAESTTTLAAARRRQQHPNAPVRHQTGRAVASQVGAATAPLQLHLPRVHTTAANMTSAVVVTQGSGSSGSTIGTQLHSIRVPHTDRMSLVLPHSQCCLTANKPSAPPAAVIPQRTAAHQLLSTRSMVVPVALSLPESVLRPRGALTVSAPSTRSTEGSHHGQQWRPMAPPTLATTNFADSRAITNTLDGGAADGRVVTSISTAVPVLTSSRAGDTPRSEVASQHHHHQGGPITTMSRALSHRTDAHEGVATEPWRGILQSHGTEPTNLTSCAIGTPEAAPTCQGPVSRWSVSGRSKDSHVSHTNLAPQTFTPDTGGGDHRNIHHASHANIASQTFATPDGGRDNQAANSHHHAHQAWGAANLASQTFTQDGSRDTHGQPANSHQAHHASRANFASRPPGGHPQADNHTQAHPPPPHASFASSFTSSVTGDGRDDHRPPADSHQQHHAAHTATVAAAVSPLPHRATPVRQPYENHASQTTLPTMISPVSAPAPPRLSRATTPRYVSHANHPLPQATANPREEPSQHVLSTHHATTHPQVSHVHHPVNPGPCAITGLPMATAAGISVDFTQPGIPVDVAVTTSMPATSSFFPSHGAKATIGAAGGGGAQITSTHMCPPQRGGAAMSAHPASGPAADVVRASGGASADTQPPPLVSGHAGVEPYAVALHSPAEGVPVMLPPPYGGSSTATLEVSHASVRGDGCGAAADAPDGMAVRATGVSGAPMGAASERQGATNSTPNTRSVTSSAKSSLIERSSSSSAGARVTRDAVSRESWGRTAHDGDTTTRLTKRTADSDAPGRKRRRLLKTED